MLIFRRPSELHSSSLTCQGVHLRQDVDPRWLPASGEWAPTSPLLSPSASSNNWNCRYHYASVMCTVYKNRHKNWQSTRVQRHLLPADHHLKGGGVRKNTETNRKLMDSDLFSPICIPSWLRKNSTGQSGWWLWSPICVTRRASLGFFKAVLYYQ